MKSMGWGNGVWFHRQLFMTDGLTAKDLVHCAYTMCGIGEGKPEYYEQENTGFSNSEVAKVVFDLLKQGE